MGLCRNLCAVKINMQTLRFDGQLGKQDGQTDESVNNFNESILGECTHTHIEQTHTHTLARLQHALATFDLTLSGIANVLIIQFYLSASHTHTRAQRRTYSTDIQAHTDTRMQSTYENCGEKRAENLRCVLRRGRPLPLPLPQPEL